MDVENFEQTMQALLDEFEKSGLQIDDFMQQKLSAAGRTDAAEYVAEINKTLDEIDQKYDSLQEAKKQGINRKEWLRKEIDFIVKDCPPDEAGKVISLTIKALKWEEGDTPDTNVSYDALEAPFIIKDMDNALVINVCSELSNEEEK